MSIEIKTRKKVGSDGILYRKIMAFKMLRQKFLPKKYLAEDINVCLVDSSSIRVQGFEGRFLSFYNVGDKIREDVFQSLLSHIQRCGNLLREINEELESLRSEWNGEETFII